MIACGPGRVLAVAGTAFFMSAAPASPVRASELDDFLGKLDECTFPAQGSPFALFAASLYQRYGNPEGNPADSPAADRTEVAIVLPPELEGAFGPATSRNFGDYTLVTLPVEGTFGGLPLRDLSFRFGNQNAIAAIALVFDASHADVTFSFGDSVARGDDRGQEAGRTGRGYSAEIPPGEPGRITCDWSS